MIEKEENSMINKAKAVFCNHPFTDGVKDKPIYIDNNNIGNFIYPDFGLDYSDLNYMYLSTPNLTVCSMEIGPGGFFNPPDYHPGDEAYFVLEGTITPFNPETGAAIEVKEDEALLIPKGALHSAYNFGDKKVKVLAVIAPKIVEEQLFPTDTDSPKKIYNYDKVRIKYHTEAWDMPQLYGSVDQLGVWPAEGSVLREKKVIYHITEDKKLKVINGDTRPVLMKFAVSNDFMDLGEYIVPSGGVVTRHSEVIEHPAEFFIFGMDGEMTVYLTETRETYILKRYEGLYLPPYTKYQLVNYGTVSARSLFMVAR